MSPNSAHDFTSEKLGNRYHVPDFNPDAVEAEAHEPEGGQEGDRRHGHRPDEVDGVDPAHAGYYIEKGAASPPPPGNSETSIVSPIYFFFR